MNSLLIHGCYDSKTLDTLKDHGIKNFSFDLRGRSLNLVPFRELQNLLGKLTTERVFLTFEDDKKETITSFLNLLSNEPFVFTLILRDARDVSFYRNLGVPFYWMFNPDAEWEEILKVTELKGILLPLKYQLLYHKLPELWENIDSRNLDVFLHAETFEETMFIKLSDEIKISIDLSQEVEKSFRTVDQDKLQNMKIWRHLNENSAGQ